MIDLEARADRVLARIEAAATRSGRNPSQVTLVAITKGQSSGIVREAYELGLRHFGENRVEEAETKVGDLPPAIIWHMVGHIQSRKAARAVAIFQTVHSVDSVKLARRLSQACIGRLVPLPILLECNVSGEGSKHGFAAERYFLDSAQSAMLLDAVEEITALPHLLVCGLMTMAPIVEDPELARPVFRHLCRLRDQLAARFQRADWTHLSMGMTDDFEVAIQEGATMVRVGRAIFADSGSMPGASEPHGET